MTTISQACAIIAEETESSLADLQHRARRLREAGLLPTGKGGRGGAAAAHLNSDHLAVMLLALLVPGSASDVVREVKTFGSLRLNKENLTLGVRERDRDGIEKMLGLLGVLQKSPTLLSVLPAVISNYISCRECEELSLRAGNVLVSGGAYGASATIDFDVYPKGWERRGIRARDLYSNIWMRFADRNEIERTLVRYPTEKRSSQEFKPPSKEELKEEFARFRLASMKETRTNSLNKQSSIGGGVILLLAKLAGDKIDISHQTTRSHQSRKRKRRRKPA